MPAAMKATGPRCLVVRGQGQPELALDHDQRRTCLVGGFDPFEKILVNWEIIIPNMWEHINIWVNENDSLT